jgi:large repetitive protein
MSNLQRTVLRGAMLLACLGCFWGADVFGQVTITTNSPLPTGVVNTAYTGVTIMATGGTAPRTFSVLTGSLPPGLSLNAASGAITGTPTTAGTSNFTIRATATAGGVGDKAFVLRINNPIGIVSGPNLPNGTQGATYSQVLTGSGGETPYVWSIISGSLPNGLSLSVATISGTTTTTGTFNFTVRITDSAIPTQTTTKAMTIVVAALTITNVSPLPVGATSTPYSQTLTAMNGTAPYTFSIISGSLPAGLALTSGVISGSPTATGTSNFTIRVVDSSTPMVNAQKAFSLVIVPTLTISTLSPMTTALMSIPYSQTLTATGGTGPYTWSLVSGTLPAGLSLSGAAISGTPTTVGTSTFTLRVTDSNTPPLTTDKAFTLSVVVPLMITTTSPLPAGGTGVAYNQGLSVAGGLAPYSFSVITGTLPAGLALAPNGTVSGTPTTAGTSNFTIRALDSSTPPQNFQRNFALTINSVLTITTESLPPGSTGVAYSQTLAVVGGTAPFTWSIVTGTLPAGLALNGATITGTPTAAGVASFTVRVADSSGQTAQKALSISVAVPLTISTSSPLPNGAVGVAYSQTLAAAGGTPPVMWSITAGALPNGLAISPGGAVTGTPTQAGSFSFTASVSDSSSPVRTAATPFQLTIEPLLTITTVSLPAAAMSSSYSVQLQASVGPPLTWSLFSGTLPGGISLSLSGMLSGTPAATGVFSFTVKVTSETPTQEFIQSYQLTIGAALSMTTTTLPQGTRFVPYSTTLVAAGGAAPYTWTVASGSLPAGIALSPAGVISGNPTAVSTSPFSIRVADAGGATVSRGFSVVIVQGVLQITTLSLPGGFQGFAYSQQMEAAGGPTPFSWAIVSGSLPSGFALTPAGVLQGNGATAFNGTISIRVTDSVGGTDTRNFLLVIGSPVGAVTLNGLASKVSPLQQIPITVSIPTPFPADLQGTLAFTFASSAVIPIDDPAVQFSTGGRTVKFTIPANTTNAVFSAPLRFVTGTVAGTVTITGAIQNGPSSLVLSSTSIDSIPPQMTSVTATRITGGLSVRLIGYSPERRVTEVEYSFDVRVNGAIQKVNLGRDVLAAFTGWFQSAASTAFGSAFGLEQLFTVAGDGNAIEAVTVTLKNAQGNTMSARTPFAPN